MNDWRRADSEKRELWKQHWRVLKWHPLTWFILMVVVAYSLEGCGVTSVR